MVCERPAMPQEKKKTERERRISRAKKVRSIQEERSCSCRGIPFKKSQLLVGTATSTSGPISSAFSAFSAKQFLSQYVHKTERSLPSSPQKKAQVIGNLSSKFSLPIAVHIESGRKKNELSEEEEEWMYNFLEKSDKRIQLPEEGILSALE